MHFHHFIASFPFTPIICQRNHGQCYRHVGDAAGQTSFQEPWGNLQIGSKVKNSTVKDNNENDENRTKTTTKWVSPPVAFAPGKMILPKWQISQWESLDVSGAKTWSYSTCSKTKTIKNNQNSKPSKWTTNFSIPANTHPLCRCEAWDLHCGLPLFCLARWKSPGMPPSSQKPGFSNDPQL